MRTISIILCLLALAGCVCTKKAQSQRAELTELDRHDVVQAVHAAEELSRTPATIAKPT